MIFIPFCFSCKKDTPSDTVLTQTDPVSSLFEPKYDVDDLLVSSLYGNGISQGFVSHISEASGLEQSALNPGMIWAHNDGGNSNEIFLFNSSNGNQIESYTIDNSLNIDWEDIAINMDASNSKMYLADFGDNFKIRPSYNIYKLAEPKYDSVFHAGSDVVQADRLNYTYAEGSQNAEALLLDPLTGDIIIATKSSNKSDIYKIGSSLLDSKVSIKIDRIGSLPLGSITGGDISDDGKSIVLRNYEDIFIWERKPGESISDVFAKVPQKLPYNGIELQGEAFCWAIDGYYTLSEAVGTIIPELYFYPKK